jgi:replication factor A1
MKSPRMTLDEMISRIVEDKGLSRKQVFDLIEKKKSLLNHMISDEGAADIVAKELGVKTYPESEDEELTLTVADLVAGMSNVTITGRIIKVNPIREFTDRTGNKSFVSNVVIIDKSGEMRVVLWGDVANLVRDNRIKQGGIVRVHEGYVKEDLQGRTELHVGRKGRIEIEPQNVAKFDFPDRSGKPNRIAELTADMVEADLAGRVKAVNPAKVVRTRDGKNVKLSSLVVEDESGATVRVVFWNDKVTSMENAKRGDNIEVVSGRVRVNKNGEIEVHVGSAAAAKLDPAHSGIISSATNNLTKIIQLKPGILNFSTEGVVTGNVQFREFTRIGGTAGKILSFTLADDTSTVRAVAWGETAERLRHLKDGDTIRINEANLKLGIRGEQEIHIKSFETPRFSTDRENTPSDSDQHIHGFIPANLEGNRTLRKDVYELVDGQTAEIRGMITRVQTKSPVYRACPKCLRKVSGKEGEWLCPKDGSVINPVARVLYNLTLDDGTGAIICVLSGSLGEELLGMKADELLLSGSNEMEHHDSILSSLLGLEIIFVGKCIFNHNQNKSEFRVTKAVRPDPRAEARLLLEHIRNDFGS